MVCVATLVCDSKYSLEQSATRQIDKYIIHTLFTSQLDTIYKFKSRGIEFIRYMTNDSVTRILQYSNVCVEINIHTYNYQFNKLINVISDSYLKHRQMEYKGSNVHEIISVFFDAIMRIPAVPATPSLTGHKIIRVKQESTLHFETSRTRHFW
ncbi:Hypothetical_protein [Hexamita inflata]|uniref:Hypothetical_protein n=1 Tax=Hexamita inflata TaxID=28002 RepID=A0AA86TUQ1_9EUKA|nr:Hypothetical protein HINF_LOCUS9978 [Hexamita inflata]